MKKRVKRGAGGTVKPPMREVRSSQGRAGPDITHSGRCVILVSHGRCGHRYIWTPVTTFTHWEVGLDDMIMAGKGTYTYG